MYKPKMIEDQKNFCCSKGHKLPVVTIALDPKLSRDQRFLCTECLENTDTDGNVVVLTKIIQQIEENQVKKMEKVDNIIMVQIKLLESLHSFVDQMKSHVIQQLNELITIMMGWIQNLQQQGSQQSQYSFLEELEIMSLQQNKSDSNLQKQVNEIQKTNLYWISQFHPKLEQFNQFVYYSKCKELLSGLQLGSDKFTQGEEQQYEDQGIQQLSTQVNIQQSQTLQSTDQQNVKPFTYLFLQECSISQNDYCLAMAFSKDCSTLVAGSGSNINVFEFQQGMLKLIQTLSEHKDNVQTLNFMTKQNQFISGSGDTFIIIWKKYQNNKWISQQKLNGHSSHIYCLELNYDEDLIVSGSEDNSIKFWMKKNEWLCQQTITDHSTAVCGLGLNQQQNRIVSCGYDSLILIIEQSQYNKQWIVKQKIKVEQFGFRVCFIENNIFTFSPFDKEQISVFEMKNEFTKIKDIPVKCGSDCYGFFPQQYINTKCILVSKNGEYVNLIRKLQNGDLLTQQSIYFGTNCLFGVMSDDGQHLITWDDKSKQIQIRRYQVQ